MKLNFRDLKQQKFTIDAEASDTVQQLKERIEAEKGWEASTQKLIYSGKILQDSNTVESYKIEEKGFIVCMVSKPKAAPKPAAAPATPKAATASTPAQPAAPAPSTSTATSNEPPATPSPAQPAAAGSTPGAGFGDNSAMLVGNRSREAIQEMVAMGFDEADATAALRAAFFNPDRAIDYLLNGIPENVRAEQAAQQAQRQAGTAAAPAATTPATTGTPAATTTPAAETQQEASEDEVNLFDMAAQTAGRGGATGGAGAGATGAGARFSGLGAGAGANPAAAGGEAVDMDFLRNSPHFQHLRQIVQQQPAMLEPILQQVAEGNPQLAQMIAANQGQFLQLLSEDMGEGGGALPPGAIAVTEEENAAIQRLIGLGFARDRVIQAYFACDKNEELAANFLFEQPEDDD